jgi:hypothetical protein
MRPKHSTRHCASKPATFPARSTVSVIPQYLTVSTEKIAKSYDQPVSVPQIRIRPLVPVRRKDRRENSMPQIALSWSICPFFVSPLFKQKMDCMPE